MNAPAVHLRAAGQVWALVSGFSPRIRTARGLLFLQAFIDDSGIGQIPMCVMGGFVAPAEKWADFAGEWQEILDIRPSIAYLKMSEAAACTGQFAHWNDERRDERIALFFSVIEKYATIGITSAVPMEPYRKIFKKSVTKKRGLLEHPYYMLFFGVVHSIAHHFVRIGHTEPIDFIFDSQPDQVSDIMESWEILRVAGDPVMRPLVANPPIFRDDKSTLPLQAADLHAWWVHRVYSDTWNFRSSPRPPFPGKRTSLNVPILEFIWSEDALKRMRRSLTHGPIKVSRRRPLG
jgi:Protein of unknown function (DUF3800)